MKDRIIAFSTLGIIFGLFFYYKVVSPVDTLASLENQNIINNDKNNQLDIVEEPISTISESANTESDCNLSEIETDVLDFSSAFKYYRTCNDVGINFTWKGNLYSTLLKETVDSDKIVINNDIVSNDKQVDRNHLNLQNQLVGIDVK
ncbi:MAG: hypothetical protein CMG01_01805 [Candidatus Marinimicrobia bacterium]|nr:hypothetical protein [Candidatus Neomarinimicrobiota bacterium]